MRYFLDFGEANAGGTPSFALYKNATTLADLAQPAISEAGAGLFYFDVPWASVGSSSITYKATCGGVELSDVISSPALDAQGTSAGTPAVASLNGFLTVGPLVARAAVQAGLLQLTRDQIATYDPFAETDQKIAQMLELLDTMGVDLASEVKTHLQREFTITTAGAATSYVLPADYSEMVDDAQWNNSGIYPLSGPITPQEERFLHAWNGVTTVRIPYRVMGNRLTFPVAPGDGLIITGLYYSRNWVQTASGTAPDSDHVTAAGDYVLFDPTLVILGLKLRYLSAKRFDVTLELSEYEKRLEWAKGNVGAARALSLNGRGNSGFRFVDNFNLPVTGWGLS